MIWIEEVRKQIDLRNKCGSCKYLNYEIKSSVGYGCVGRTDWRTKSAHLRHRTTKACKYYQWDGKTTIVDEANHYKRG